MKERRGGSGLPRPGLLLLAGCFFLGSLLGQAMAFRMSDHVYSQMHTYLMGFCTLDQRYFPDAIFSTLVLYLRYPLVGFFLGFVSAGMVLLPLSGVIFGFFLSFSVGCFAASLGDGGVYLALAVMGVRSCITIPCFFALAAPAWEVSCALAGRGTGKRRRAASFGKSRWIRYAVVTGILLTGVCLDVFLSPYMLEQVLRCF